MRGKVSASHLERRAYVYVRQSTTAQVFHHGESTHRQYALADRAVALGWQRDSIEVVDEDQGRSGATTEGRTGFARLVDDVAHGQVGAVLAVEVSRLARSSQDWHRLLSLCAIAETVVIDENAIYDPADKDDKLLLDIKGTMSEAELHWLRLRLIGACQSKARRGELRISPPTGYVWTERGLALDPDEAVQRAVRMVLDRFAVEPSAWAVSRWARATSLSFPTTRRYADGTSEVDWKPLGASRVYELLHNPTYAGVYTYGRRPKRKRLVDGKIRNVRASGRDPDKWAVRLDGAHPGYISWETYVNNQRKLRENGRGKSGSTRGAPREGSALLGGLVLCGRCGVRMEPCYGSAGGLQAYYYCRSTKDRTHKTCWTVPAEPIDGAVERVFLETMVPTELEMSLAVEREVSAQAHSLDQHWKLRIEQAEYEARRAERRYKAVDPDNRVVARTLEREWEQALRELEQIRQQREQAKREHRVELTAEDRKRIRALARDLPKVWSAPSTPRADRKEMLRLVIEAISLHPIDVPQRSTRVRIAWKSGAVTDLEVPRPDRRDRLRTPASSRERLRELATEGLRDEQIAERLNAEGLRTGRDRPWDLCAVRWARRRERIDRSAPDAPRSLPLPERDPRGRYSVEGAARHFGVRHDVVRRWLKNGLIQGSSEPYSTYSTYRRVWWLTIDAETNERLTELARRSRTKAKEAPRIAR